MAYRPKSGAQDHLNSTPVLCTPSQPSGGGRTMPRRCVSRQEAARLSRGRRSSLDRERRSGPRPAPASAGGSARGSARRAGSASRGPSAPPWGHRRAGHRRMAPSADCTKRSRSKPKRMGSANQGYGACSTAPTGRFARPSLCPTLSLPGLLGRIRADGQVGAVTNDGAFDTRRDGSPTHPQEWTHVDGGLFCRPCPRRHPARGRTLGPGKLDARAGLSRRKLHRGNDALAGSLEPLAPNLLALQSFGSHRRA